MEEYSSGNIHCYINNNCYVVIGIKKVALLSHLYTQPEGSK